MNARTLRGISGVGVGLGLAGMVWMGAVGAAENSSSTPKTIVNGAGPASWVGDLSPIADSDWNYQRAAHLLERAGFGGTPEEIARLAAMSPKQAVDELVDYETKDNTFLPKFEPSGYIDPGVIPTIEENTVRAAINEVTAKGSALGVKPDNSNLPLQPIIDEAYYHVYASRLESRRLALWWTNNMLQTNRPLEEKISVFWHDHFALSYERVEDHRKLEMYLATLHKNATGNFRDFVLAIAQDPAMLVYLDNGLNVKGHANENFAREVLELFTMGEGRGYTEKDIREAARAFTGWSQNDIVFVARPELHDTAEKTVFGKSSNFDGTTMVDWIVEQDATTLYITQKLYKYFVAQDIPAGTDAKLAKVFRDNKLELKPLLKTMFLSKDFYSENAYATQIKTPIHLVVSTCKKLGLKEVPGVPEYRSTMVAMGQELLAPPNVAGWEGGRSWINPATLLTRGNYILELFNGEPPRGAQGTIRPSAGGQTDRPRLAPGEDDDNNMAAGARGAAVRGAAARGARRSAAGSADNMDSMDTMMNAPARGARGAGGPRAGGAMAGGSMAAGATMSAEDPNNPNNRYADRETYNLAMGVRRGMAKATRRVKEIPATKADVNFAAMMKASGARTVEEAVAYCELRFLRTPLDERAHGALVKYLNGALGADAIDYDAATTEPALRELTHLIMSTPEYQLG